MTDKGNFSGGLIVIVLYILLAIILGEDVSKGIIRGKHEENISLSK
mgnify:CR=1 FL=1